MAVERTSRPQPEPEGKFVDASNRFGASATAERAVAGTGEIAQPLPGVKRKEKVRKPPKPPMSLRKKIALGAIAVAISAASVGGMIEGQKILRDGNSQSGQTETSGIFDNDATTQTVRPGINTIVVPREDLHSVLEGSIKPVEAGKYPKTSILFPVKVGNQNIVSSTTYLNGLLNPFTGEGEQHAVDGKTLRIPTNGTEIIVPVEGAELFRLTPRSEGSGRTYFTGVVVKFKGPDGAIHYLNIGPSNYKVGELSLADTVKNAPYIGENGLFAIPTKETDSQKGISLPIGTPILKTSTENYDIQIRFITSSPVLPYPGRVRSPFNFITQDGKLVTIP